MSPQIKPIPHFEHLAADKQASIVLDLLKSAHFNTLQTVASHILPRLKKDFLACLPTEIAILVLRYLNLPSLARAGRVSRGWNRLLESDHVDATIWKTLLVREGWLVDPPHPVSDQTAQMADKPRYRRAFEQRFGVRKNWFRNRSRQLSFPGHGFNVVTCLQMDADKIVSGSDDLSIQIFDIRDGTLRQRLLGHEGTYLVIVSFI